MCQSANAPTPVATAGNQVNAIRFVATISIVAIALQVTPRRLAAQQADTARVPVVRVDGDGITVSSADSATKLTFRFRTQLTTTLSLPESDTDVDRSLATEVRRARIRLGGSLWDPRLGVSLQLGLAPRDHSGGNPGTTAVLRDANISWQQTPQLRFQMGLGKLPGNRQRTISSGDQQFAERGLVNNTFTTDRDVHVMAVWKQGGRAPWSWAGAVSTGEGRASAGPDMGLAYTTRFDIQPLGAFTGNNADREGDHAREPAPRLLLGVVFTHNDRAWRSRGQLGDFLDAPRDLTTVLADVTLKYRGFSLYLEGAHRDAGPTSLPVALGDDPRGKGGLLQIGYLTRAGWEPSFRIARVELQDDIDANQASLNLVRYLRGHRIKYMIEAGREWGNDPSAADRWLVRTNFEVGI